jgi:hypothetical protein
LLEKYDIAPSTLLADMGPIIKKAWKDVKDTTSIHKAGKTPIIVRLSRMQDYKIEFSKPGVYSPTFPENMKIVKRTMFDALMVTDKCPIHGRPETVARFYELDKDEWEYLDNGKLRRELVQPLLSDIKKGKIKGGETNRMEQEFLVRIMFETGMRLGQVGKLKVSDLDVTREYGMVKY